MDDNPLRIIVAEDEVPAREEILHLLDQIGGNEVIATAGDGIEALKLIRKDKPDLVLLDIEMPGMTGMEVAREVLREEMGAAIIFTTAYERFALEAFDVNAVDYLLKPIRQSKLDLALEKARNRLPEGKHYSDKLQEFIESYLQKDKKPARFISVYKGDKIIPLKISSIHFAEARGRHVWIATDEGEFQTPMNFRQAEETLAPPDFFTCHRSFIIHPESIESIDLWVNSSYRLKMKGSKTLVPVSRNRKEDFRKLMGI